MKQLLITIAALLLVGCGEPQQSVPQAEAKSIEPVAETAKPEPPIAKAPDISIHDAAYYEGLEAVKQHLAAGTDVSAKDEDGVTPLHEAFQDQETAELLIEKGADVNAMSNKGQTPLDWAMMLGLPEVADLLSKHGGKTGEELKAAGN